MHIQADTRTLGKQPGPPTYVGKARQAAPVRQPTNRYAARPRPARALTPNRGHPYRLAVLAWGHCRTKGIDVLVPVVL